MYLQRADKTNNELEGINNQQSTMNYELRTMNQFMQNKPNFTESIRKYSINKGLQKCSP